jgi:hypothetical protein
MKTLERFIETTRRHVRANAEDVRAWVVSPAVPADGEYADQLIGRVVSVLAGLRAADRLYQSVLREQPGEAAVLADQTSAAFGAYAALTAEVLRVMDQLPAAARPSAERLAELQACRDEAIEMEGVMHGEAEFARGEPGTSWEELQRQLGM